MDDNTRTPTGWHQQSQGTASEPHPAALGVLGLVIGLLSAILALTVYLTLLALLGAAVAWGLGVLALGDDRSRGVGIGAIMMAALAIVCATAVLVPLG